MLYQKILSGEMPYRIRLGTYGEFAEHRHADIELLFCIEGNLRMRINKTEYTLFKGDLAFITPMTAHSLPTNTRTNKALGIIVGASLLKENFSQFSTLSVASPLIKLSEDTEYSRKLSELLFECAELCHSTDNTDQLLIKGNIYKICSYLLKLLNDGKAIKKEIGNMTAVAAIETALEIIYGNYAEQITVKDAAIATGYGKSNFCKIFKHVTGYTFHALLNMHRCENACGLLTESTASISEIAQTVGFSEAKTFCRVFKSIFGITPGEYRLQG